MLVRVLKAEVAPQARRPELQNSINSLCVFFRSSLHGRLVFLFSCFFERLEIALQFVYNTLHKGKNDRGSNSRDFKEVLRLRPAD